MAFYTHGGVPAQGSAGASSEIRAEFDSIAASFVLLGALTADRAIVNNSAGTARTVTAGTLALPYNFAIAGAAITLTATGTTNVTLPTSGTLISTASGTAVSATNLAGGAAGKIPYQSGADTTLFSAVGTSGQAVLSGGTGAPTFTTGTLTLAGNFATSGAYACTITLSNTTTVTFPTTGTLLSTATAVTVAQGGTGAATFTSNGVLIGNGTGAFTATAEGATNTLLHGVTGGDPSFSAVVEADLTLADNTTGNASTSAHGFLKKLDNSSTNFMNGQGNWAVPSGLTTGAGVETTDLTLGSSASAAHGLGAAPSFVYVYLECITTEGGWAAGDRIPLGSMWGNYGESGVVFGSNATTVYIKINATSLAQALNLSSGAVFTPTNTKWKAGIIPYKV